MSKLRAEVFINQGGKPCRGHVTKVNSDGTCDVNVLMRVDAEDGDPKKREWHVTHGVTAATKATTIAEQAIEGRFWLVNEEG